MTASLISVFGLNVPTHEAIESVFSLAIGSAPVLLAGRLGVGTARHDGGAALATRHVLGIRRATQPVCCP
jgi:hypothetical protein